MNIVLQARSRSIAKYIELCARNFITFDECCLAISTMGFKTTSVYEMVRSAEEEIRYNEKKVSEGRGGITEVQRDGCGADENSI